MPVCPFSRLVSSWTDTCPIVSLDRADEVVALNRRSDHMLSRELLITRIPKRGNEWLQHSKPEFLSPIYEASKIKSK